MTDDTWQVLMWMVHYLERRSPFRAKNMVANLPFTKRMAFTFGRLLQHAKLLEYLRSIIEDKPLSADEQVEAAPVGVGDPDDEEEGKGPVGTVHEKARKAGMVNAVLASANARRVDVPLSDNSMSRALAASEDPLHQVSYHPWPL